MSPRRVSLALAVCCLGCESLLMVPTNEDVASWGEHRTVTGDRAIVYKLPPDPHVVVHPRRVAQLTSTSREAQAFAIVDYGYGLPEPRTAELKVLMEVRPVFGGGMEPGWTTEQFAQFYWARTMACREAISPFNPKFEALIQSELADLGEVTWYHLVYPDTARGDRVSGDAFIRPISPTHVLAVYGLYWDYEFMSLDAIERRRGLVRKIVAEIRVEPPFESPP